ncbi:hypothetical protein IAU60_001896 [Kwoniella sp. DSM 27419]
MVRGRSIDRSLPPSRALLTQREYRARKADELKRLGDTVDELRKENMQLREEILVLGAAVGVQCRCRAAVQEARRNLRDALDALDSLDGDAWGHPVSEGGGPSLLQNHHPGAVGVDGFAPTRHPATPSTGRTSSHRPPSPLSLAPSTTRSTGMHIPASDTGQSRLYITPPPMDAHDRRPTVAGTTPDLYLIEELAMEGARWRTQRAYRTPLEETLVRGGPTGYEPDWEVVAESELAKIRGQLISATRERSVRGLTDSLAGQQDTIGAGTGQAAVTFELDPNKCCYGIVDCPD